MTERKLLKPPFWFWLVVLLAVVWNAIGIGTFFQELNMTAEEIAKLPAQEAGIYERRPDWLMTAYGIAVFFGFAGSILLFLRFRLANPVLLVSLLAVIAQTVWMFFFSGYFQEAGWDLAALPLLVLAVAVLLWNLAVTAQARRWIG